jgi:hypothetical protein
LDIDEAFSALSASAELGDFTLEFSDLSVSFVEGLWGRTALHGRRRHPEFSSVSCRSPVEHMRAVEPLASKEPSERAVLGACVRLGEDASLVLRAERSSPRLRNDFGRRHRAVFFGHHHDPSTIRPAR